MGNKAARLNFTLPKVKSDTAAPWSTSSKDSGILVRQIGSYDYDTKPLLGKLVQLFHGLLFRAVISSIIAHQSLFVLLHALYLKLLYFYFEDPVMHLSLIHI